MNNETCRKAFEEYAKSQGFSLIDPVDREGIYNMWWAWKTAWNLKPRLSVEEIGNICYEKSKEWLNSDFSVRASISQSDYVAQAIYEKQEKL